MKSCNNSVQFMVFRNAEEKSRIEIPAVQQVHCRTGLSVFIAIKLLVYYLF